MKHPSPAILSLFFIGMMLVTACGAKPVSGQVPTNTAAVSPTLAFPPTDTQPAPQPTSATQPSSPASAAPSSDVATVNVTQLNVRVGPGVNYTTEKTLDQGAALTLLGKSTDGNWYLVQLQDGSGGWVFSAYVTTSANLAALQVMQAPTSANATTAPSAAGSIPLTGGTAVPTLAPTPVPTTSPALVPTAVATLVPAPANTHPIVVTIANNQAQVTLSNFPAGKSVIATLGALGTSKSLRLSGPTTDGSGSASFSFSMPFSWPDGTPLTQQSLYMTVSTTDGAFSRTLSFPFFSGR